MPLIPQHSATITLAPWFLLRGHIRYTLPPRRATPEIVSIHIIFMLQMILRITMHSVIFPQRLQRNVHQHFISLLVGRGMQVVMEWSGHSIPLSFVRQIYLVRPQLMRVLWPYSDFFTPPGIGMTQRRHCVRR